MEILKQYPVLDTDDVDAEADFWAAVLGGTAEPDFQSAAGEWRTIVVDGREVLGIQLAPDHVRPQWPDGPQHQQMHLDLYIADLEAAHAEVTGWAPNCCSRPRIPPPRADSRSTPTPPATRSASAGAERR